MNRTGILITAIASTVLLAACGGDDDINDAASGKAPITADNALKVSQDATEGLTEMEDASESLTQLTEAFGSITARNPDYTFAEKLSAKPEETLQCPGGGSITVVTNDTTSTTQTVDYIASDCVTSSGETVNGELYLTVGPWDEFPQNSFEVIMETGSAGISTTSCGFTGGMVTRFHSDQATDPNGVNSFVIEIGTTDSGFTAGCTGAEEISVAANTLVRNEFSYSYAADGTMTSSSSLSINGSFEASDGSGYVDVSATNLEYGVANDGSSLYGEATCPSAGSMTITGAGGSTVSVYFGDDAPAPYVVQVIGPDGYLAEFETCEAFLAATG